MIAPDTISILGGGWSAGEYDRTRLPGVVIGVNDSMLLAPVDYGVTMDRLWIENRWDQVDRACYHQDASPRPRLNVVYVRSNALQNKRERPTWLSPFECNHNTHSLSPTRGRLNGTNSGLCALSLAYQLKPRRLLLFGFDMCRNKAGAAYWFPDYPWAKEGGATGNARYKLWAQEFADVRKQMDAVGVEVLNASLHSAIEAFPKVKPESVLL